MNAELMTVSLCYRLRPRAAACLLDADASEMSVCISLNQQCAALCRVTAQLLAAQSELSEQLCTITSMACQLAGWECQKHQHPHCQTCAEICLQCADSCMTVGMAE